MTRKTGPIVSQGDKHCFKCATTKREGEFSRNRSAPDGRASQCKPCARETRAETRVKKKRIAAFVASCRTRGTGLRLADDVIEELAQRP